MLDMAASPCQRGGWVAATYIDICMLRTERMRTGRECHGRRQDKQDKIRKRSRKGGIIQKKRHEGLRTERHLGACKPLLGSGDTRCGMAAPGMRGCSV